MRQRETAFVDSGAWLALAPSRDPMHRDLSDLEAAGAYFQRSDLHKLSMVDAANFVIMKRTGITLAYAFDHLFAVVGFRIVG